MSILGSSRGLLGAPLERLGRFLGLLGASWLPRPKKSEGDPSFCALLGRRGRIFLKFWDGLGMIFY